MFEHMYRNSRMGDVLVMLLLFFLGENLHDGLCMWLFKMRKWDAIDGWGFKCMYSECI